MNDELAKIFGNRVRVRCCACIFSDDKLALVNHRGLNAHDTYWMPPGGAPEIAETLTDCVEREVLEETGLRVQTGGFINLYEYTEPPLHAVELFFKADLVAGKMRVGSDPELMGSAQIIRDVRWFTRKEVLEINRSYIHPFIIKFVTF